MGEGETTVLELEMELNKQQIDNNIVVAGLMRVADPHPELRDAVEAKLAEAGIQLPAPDDGADAGGEGEEDFLE